MPPVIRYAKSGDVHVAYHVFGEGPLNLVLAPFFVSNIEVLWESPEFARWMLRFGSYARVAMFDKRGTGMSDRVSELPGLDQRIDDFRAVMDAAGMERRRFSAYLKAVLWQRFSLPHIPIVVGH
jgi:pimeloyl-ACP methyl ester carboxylesterase